MPRKLKPQNHSRVVLGGLGDVGVSVSRAGAESVDYQLHHGRVRLQGILFHNMKLKEGVWKDLFP